MKKLLLLVLVLPTGIWAQNFINDGGTLTLPINTGIALNGNVENLNNGTISNNGMLEVGKNYTQQPASTYTGNGILRFFSDSAAAIDANMVLAKLEVEKPNGLAVLADLDVSTQLEILQGHLFLTGGNVNLANNTVLTTADSTRFVVTPSQFSLNIYGLQDDTLFFPVGHTPQTYNPFWLVNQGDLDTYGMRVFNDIKQFGLTGATVFPEWQDELLPRTWVLTESLPNGTSGIISFGLDTLLPVFPSQRYSSTYSNFNQNATVAPYSWVSYNQTAVVLTGTSPKILTQPYQSQLQINGGTSAFIVGREGWFLYPESVNETPFGSLSLYPNPAQGGQTLVLASSQPNNTSLCLSITNALGQTVLSQNNPNGIGNNLSINLPAMAAGVYSVTLQNKENIYTNKLVIK